MKNSPKSWSFVGIDCQIYSQSPSDKADDNNDDDDDDKDNDNGVDEDTDDDKNHNAKENEGKSENSDLPFEFSIISAVTMTASSLENPLVSAPLPPKNNQFGFRGHRFVDAFHFYLHPFCMC